MGRHSPYLYSGPSL
uniref:Uncharacterized protein n=1 Tax=Anguilla anguilla TaxID=7936 RepID=A0A0E9USP2_ANGAN